MNRRQHATHARNLIKACGGLEESAENCRVGKSQLSEAQDPNGTYYLPADVIVALEAHCGDRSYSRALYEAGAPGDVDRDLREEAADALEAAADLSKRARAATRRGRLSEADRADLLKLATAAQREIAEVLEALANR